MSQTLNRLSAQKVKGAKATELNPKTGKLKAVRLADGGGLYLVVTERQKSWVFIYSKDKQRRDVGLGPVSIGLATARSLAAECRQQLAAGLDPLTERRASKPKSNVPTFAAMAEELITSKADGWKGKRGAEEWRRTLSLDKDRKGKPKGFCQSLVNIPVDAVTVDHVLAVLRPIWSTKHVTASRLRERLELVLDAARAAGHRQGENPARWRGHLAHILPKIRHRKAHHEAMAYADVPAYMAALRARSGVRARALEFTALAAARTGETIGAVWSEIDLEARVWTIPAARMKATRPHRVPLSDRAVAILEDMAALRPDRCDGSSPVFPGARDGKPLAAPMMLKLLKATHPDLTVHGFRSSFRDWAGDQTGHSREAIEMALAHAVGDDTEAAYWRSDLLDRRRALMDDWCAYVTGAAPEGATAAPGAKEPAPALDVLRVFPAGLTPANAA